MQAGHFNGPVVRYPKKPTPCIRIQYDFYAYLAMDHGDARLSSFQALFASNHVLLVASDASAHVEPHPCRQRTHPPSHALVYCLWPFWQLSSSGTSSQHALIGLQSYPTFSSCAACQSD